MVEQINKHGYLDTSEYIKLAHAYIRAVARPHLLTSLLSLIIPQARKLSRHVCQPNTLRAPRQLITASASSIPLHPLPPPSQSRHCDLLGLCRGGLLKLNPNLAMQEKSVHQSNSQENLARRSASNCPWNGPLIGK